VVVSIDFEHVHDLLHVVPSSWGGLARFVCASQPTSSEFTNLR